MDVERFVFDHNVENRKSVLKEYYGRYLTEIRGLSKSTVNHYLDALNNISKKLKTKGIVETDIYEIMDLDSLVRARETLYADPDFIALNRRGNQMYSAGLNNYYRFASGKGFAEIRESTSPSRMKLMDIPIEPGQPQTVSRTEWSRSNILREQALSFAGYACEIDQGHKSFIAEKTNKSYMEGHHAIPMNNQPQFDRSLDVYANIVCLCPVCHRRIHHGLKTNK